MNTVEQNEHTVHIESNRVVAQILLKSIGLRTIELCQAGTRKVAESFGRWSQSVDGSEEDSFVVYESVQRSKD